MYSKTNNMYNELSTTPLAERKKLIKQAGKKLGIPEDFESRTTFDMQFAIKIQGSSNLKLRQFINGEITKL